MAENLDPRSVADASRRSCLRVGIADDDADLRSILAQFVQLLGHTVVCVVGDGQSLLNESSQQEIDLALVDFDMPFDGLAVAEELSRTKRIPVIMVSGHSDLEMMVRPEEPVAEYLRKPVSLEMLEAAIAAATQ
jgi:DNA-binding response OmpR family regulator